MESIIAGIPREELDEEIDPDGVPKSIGQIAKSMDEWEGEIADGLGLSDAERAAIRRESSLDLQKRNALKKWKAKSGSPTFGALIEIFCNAERKDLAKAVVKLLKPSGGASKLVPSKTSKDASTKLPKLEPSDHGQQSNSHPALLPDVPVPMDVPEDWNPRKTEPDSDGPDYRQSYVPYAREFTSKTNRTMKHKPRLKLDNDDKILTTLDTHPVQLPSSLVGNYPMKRRSLKKGRGLCLVFNNENFDDPRKQRNGTLRDEYNLVETFRFLGYRVEIRRDISAQDIEKIFDDIGSMINPKDDSFVCCILSHGCNNIIGGSDGKNVTIRTEDNSLEMKLSRCAKLENKPKLFFLSTCRTRVPKADGEEPEPDCDQNPRADFAFNYATLPGEQSYRHFVTGTFYINKLCQMLCQYATKATLSDIQKMVAQEVVQKVQEVSKTMPKLVETQGYQMPTLEEQTTKNVYFFEDFFPTKAS